jgi:hypothetical protein
MSVATATENVRLPVTGNVEGDEAGGRRLAAGDADHLHRTALASFRLGNRGRLSLCEVLRTLYDSRQFLELGYPSIAAYARQYFRFGRSETYEAIRVARAFEGLPKCLSAFRDGKIDWTAVKEITRIATAATEDAWLQHASRRTNAEVRAEVQDAIDKGRDRPRDDRYGLPNLAVRLVLKFSRSEQERVRKGLATLVPGISKGLGGREVNLEEVILFVADRLLAGDSLQSKDPMLDDGAVRMTAPEGEGAVRRSGGDPGRDPAMTVLYHFCPSCRRGRVATEEGFVEVERDEIERIEAVAKHQSLDAPTPPALRRKVVLRDGGRCSNPICHHPADHCHHVVFRRDGGRTAIWNEIALCATCHALVHSGLLRVEGDPDSGLRWNARGENMRSDPGDEIHRADAQATRSDESAHPDGNSPQSSNVAHPT